MTFDSCAESVKKSPNHQRRCPEILEVIDHAPPERLRPAARPGEPETLLMQCHRARNPFFADHAPSFQIFVAPVPPNALTTDTVAWVVSVISVIFTTPYSRASTDSSRAVSVPLDAV